MRLLGVDWGGKRIGIAVAETDPFALGTRPSLAASGKLKVDSQAIYQRYKVEEANAIVLGLPIEEDGVEGKMARIIRQLAGHLETAGAIVQLVDESFTSVEAETMLLETDMKASERRKVRDGEAAARILERFVRGQQ